jgi:hypothetical protein
MNIYMGHRTWIISLQGGFYDTFSTPCSGLHDGRRCWPRPDSHPSRILGLHQITEVPRHRITFAPLHRNSHLLPWWKWIAAPDQHRRVRRHPRCSNFESASSESIHENFSSWGGPNGLMTGIQTYFMILIRDRMLNGLVLSASIMRVCARSRDSCRLR